MSKSEMDIEPSHVEVAGRWSQVHKFSPQNPIFTFNSVDEGIYGKGNLLFIFELMCNFQNCKLCVFVENVCGQLKGVSHKSPSFLAGKALKQSMASHRSFFTLFTESSKSFYTVPALGDKAGSVNYTMLDLNSTGLNIVHRN